MRVLGPCPCQGCGTLVNLIHDPWNGHLRWVHEAGVTCPSPASARLALEAAIERQAAIEERQPKVIVRPFPPLAWMDD